MVEPMRQHSFIVAQNDSAILLRKLFHRSGTFNKGRADKRKTIDAQTVSQAETGYAISAALRRSAVVSVVAALRVPVRGPRILAMR